MTVKARAGSSRQGIAKTIVTPLNVVPDPLLLLLEMQLSCFGEHARYQGNQSPWSGLVEVWVPKTPIPRARRPPLSLDPPLVSINARGA